MTRIVRKRVRACAREKARNNPFSPVLNQSPWLRALKSLRSSRWSLNGHRDSEGEAVSISASPSRHASVPSPVCVPREKGGRAGSESQAAPPMVLSWQVARVMTDPWKPHAHQKNISHCTLHHDNNNKCSLKEKWPCFRVQHYKFNHYHKNT